MFQDFDAEDKVERAALEREMCHGAMDGFNVFDAFDVWKPNVDAYPFRKRALMEPFAMATRNIKDPCRLVAVNQGADRRLQATVVTH
jgi:hypothetical protein